MIARRGVVIYVLISIGTYMRFSIIIIIIIIVQWLRRFKREQYNII